MMLLICPHKPKAGCDCRKPQPKLLKDLAVKHNINLSRSYMVGDTDTDIQAGKKAGTKAVIIGDSDPLADAVFPSVPVNSFIYHKVPSL